MSNLANLIEWASAQTDAVLGEALVKLGIVQNDAGHDAPDENLAVLVSGINPARSESTKRVLIEEIVVSAPDGYAKRIALANISRANALLEFGFATECAAYSKLNQWGAADPNSPLIPNTLAAASRNVRTGQEVYRTVAQYRDAINALPASVTGNGAGFGAGQPTN